VLENIKLQGSELIGTDFSNTTIHNSNFNNCKIGAGGYKYLQIYGSSFKEAYFNNFIGNEVCFYNCDLSNVVFESCYLNNLSLINTTIGDFEKWEKMLKNPSNKNVTRFLANHVISRENTITKKDEEEN